MKNKRQEKAQKDYSLLCKLAAQAKQMREKESIAAKSVEESLSILSTPLNRYIKKIYKLEDQELHTFNKWKEKGFKVKKGEKGFIFFSTPKTFKKEVETVKGDKQDISFQRFCKCFLFSANQVEAV